MTRPLCPHCTLPLARDPGPGEAIRCPSCGLLVGFGRALHEPPPERRTGAAAGTRAARARRVAADEQRSEREPSAMLAAIAHATAARPGARELTMLEYERLCHEDGSLPELSELIATFGTWKELSRRLRASREAVDPTGERRR